MKSPEKEIRNVIEICALCILFMEDHLLKTLLQLQLGSDAAAVLHLPYTLSSLKTDSLLPSSHTQKWISRINSLLHAKDAGPRWAGLCLANRTSILAKDIMVECAQTWVTSALQFLMVKTSRGSANPTNTSRIEIRCTSCFKSVHNFMQKRVQSSH
jgi:hypothetical protein